MAHEREDRPVRVGFVLHVMQVAGAEVLVAETIRRLGPRIEPTVFCLDGIGPLGERLRGEGVPVISLGRRPGLDLGVSWRMAQLLRSRNVEVLHTHQYAPFFYGALAAVASAKRPRVIFTEHGRHYPDVVSSKRRWTNRWVLDRLANEVNAVCAFSAQHLAQQDGFASARIAVIENGIDASRYGPAADRSALLERLGLRMDRRFVATIARFHPVKDHPTLLRAFARCAQTRPDVDLLLVGDGPTRGELERLTVDLGLHTRVHFLGVRDDVPAILGVVDAFALTSLSEAASITLLEAMASRLPVIVTAVGGNPELVRQGIDGLLAPRGDDESIATALGQVLDDPVLARRLGTAAEARVRERFQLDRTIESYYKLYTQTPKGRQVA